MGGYWADVNRQYQSGVTNSFLAQRLNTSVRELAARREDPDFKLWAGIRDPLRLLWEYSPEKKKYFCVGILINHSRVKDILNELLNESKYINIPFIVSNYENTNQNKE